MWRNPLQKLARLVDQAAKKLNRLGQPPLAIASAANKFNDAHEDDYWCSVQLGPYLWEQSQFFGATDGFGSAEEFSTQPLDSNDYGSAKANAKALNAARSLLRELDRAGWHKLASEAIGLPSHGGILAVVIQFEQVWLHCSHPQGSDADEIYALVEGKLEKFAKIDDRFDQIVGRAELIRCSQPDPKIVEQLPPVAKSHFGLTIVDEDTSLSLAQLLVDLSLKIDDLVHSDGGPARPFACLLGFTKWDDQRYQWYSRGHGRSDYGGARFAIGGTYFDRGYFNRLSHTRQQSDEDNERFRILEDGPYEKVDEFLHLIDQTQIRRSFEKATGTDTFDRRDLFLLVSNAMPYLRFRNRLYGFNSDGVSTVVDLNNTWDTLGPSNEEWLNKLWWIFTTPTRRQ